MRQTAYFISPVRWSPVQTVFRLHLINIRRYSLGCGLFHDMYVCYYVIY